MPSAVIELIALRCADQLDALGVALRGIPQDDPEPFPEHVLSRIKAGDYEAREVHSGGQRVGWTVFQVETFPSGHRELVSIATYCRPAASPLRVEISAALDELARSRDCRSIRLHTVRAGLVRESLTLGYHLAEIVLRKPLSNEL